MPDNMRLYLDQMFNIRVADALAKAGYDVIRASEIGQARADDKEILLPFLKNHRQEEFKDHLIIVSEYKTKWIMTAL